MKVKAFLFGMFLLAGTATAFAGTNAEAKEAKNLNRIETAKVSVFKKGQKDFEQTSCTVTVAYNSTKITITATCDCPQLKSCDIAYQTATLVLRFQK